ncbi:LOW QUALITY PROTEIN: AP-3 complex subunit beta-2 [Musca vetustissima]|uniref:LOW QUALITY PROTEIN: AP-3 complex subunit beta-2 n=1 Tax=Musca vetustissima TaxID=27455 RepID=UPI002AB6DA67|nr:LOW QUALITY PROTEIN: AP-3 complex subunit beta-2 [Musca vetustissima]
MLSSSSPITFAGSSSSAMQQQSNAFAAYGDHRGGIQTGLDIEYGTDPASGSIFKYDGRKHDDLKQMLDSNKDGLKLEAMKRIIGMIARGRDASDLFPAVVKNVVSKNIEVKKLVYVYLVRYCEDQQDLALLSISTFQRALKDPNQLIRASALRVLSSIRVSMIVPIVMLAIRDSASDMSPYVRKTAAHAIPKLFSVDPEQKDELVTVIEKLLSDRTTLVVGSAVMAFEEVCPERVDLIHKNYRKLCNLLVDVDEWGQVIIINMLTRYARTQFVDPNADEVSEEENAQEGNDKKFYDDSDSQSNDDSDDDEAKKSSKTKSKPKIKSPNSSPSSSYHVDLDHRLLLRQTKPLLQSRNASVVMAVAQLYHHVAPRQEVQIVAKSLIRLLRSHKEVQSVVLTCIASMSTKRKAIFEPHIKSFFVRTSDPTHIKLLKLEILTNLASAASISLILREFQTYISSSDRSFVASTIQAIGRCAASIKEVTETCLSGLVHLLSNRDEHVVAESVIVIKNLLQTKAAQHYEIISQMAKLLDFIKVPAARSSILWLIGEYNEKVPKIAPDVLRKLAKTFVDEEDAVKLQVLNMAVKLYLTNPQQTSLLCQYVFTLARYDVNYDIRDRARFLKQFIFPVNSKSGVLSEAAKKIFLSAKPAPTLESKYHARNNYQLGSLSHYLNMRCTGYNDLPSFPAEGSDPTVRNVEGFMHEPKFANNHKQERTPLKDNNNSSKQAKTKNAAFYSESEGKSSEYSNNSSGSSTSSSSSSEGSGSSSSSSGSETESDNENANKQQQQKSTTPSSTNTKQAQVNALNNNATKKINRGPATASVSSGNQVVNNANGSGTSDSESSSSYGSSSGSSSSSESASESEGSDTESDSGQHSIAKKHNNNNKSSNHASGSEQKKTEAKSNLDLLLDLDDIPPIGPVMTPSLGGFLTPGVKIFFLILVIQILITCRLGTPMTSLQTTLLPQNAANRLELVGPSYIAYNHKELLNKLSGHGLQVSYRYTRSPHLYSSSMVSIELQFVNQSSEEICNIQMGQKSLPPGMQMQEFAPINQLQPGQCATSILGVDFNDSTHAIDFEITSDKGTSRVALKPIIGELIRSVQISDTMFKEERLKLRGMNEHQTKLKFNQDAIKLATLKQKIFECINVAYLSARTEENPALHYFVGQTMTSKSLVLLTCDWSNNEELLIQVNCEKMVIGSMVLNELTNYLNSSLKN